MMLTSRTQQEALQVDQVSLLHMHLQWDNFNDINKHLKEADKELHEIMLSILNTFFINVFAALNHSGMVPTWWLVIWKISPSNNRTWGNSSERCHLYSPPNPWAIFGPVFMNLIACILNELQQIINFLANEKDHNCSPKQIFNSKMRLAWQFRWIFSLPHAFSFHEKPSHSASRDSQLLPYCPPNY